MKDEKETEEILQANEDLRGEIEEHKRFEVAERKQAEEALRQSENKYRALMEQASDGFFLHDRQGNILEVNPKGLEMLGYSWEELQQRNIKEIIPLEDLATSPLRFISLAQSEEKSFLQERRLIRKNGTICPVEIGGTLLEDGNIYAIARDITERKQLEAQLNHAQKMEAIGTLAGGMAHNFNNLLQVISGGVSMIGADMDASDPKFEILSLIEKSIKRGSSLTHQILGLARGGNYSPTLMDLNELLNGIIAMFFETKKEIKIISSLQDHLWAIVADKNLIEQVLLNLFTNASQAMPRGGQLYLETKNVEIDSEFAALHDLRSGRFVNFSIIDSGIGMDNATKQRVFEPFFTTREVGEGTGLGLASAFGIVKNHRGIIAVESEVGKGTTFNIYLPAHPKAV